MCLLGTGLLTIGSVVTSSLRSVVYGYREFPKESEEAWGTNGKRLEAPKTFVVVINNKKTLVTKVSEWCR